MLVVYLAVCLFSIGSFSIANRNHGYLGEFSDVIFERCPVFTPSLPMERLVRFQSRNPGRNISDFKPLKIHWNVGLFKFLEIDDLNQRLALSMDFSIYWKLDFDECRLSKLAKETNLTWPDGLKIVMDSKQTWTPNLLHRNSAVQKESLFDG